MGKDVVDVTTILTTNYNSISGQLSTKNPADSVPCQSRLFALQDAFRALPASDRFLPPYQTRLYLSGNSPLDDAILDVLELPKTEQYSAWSGLARHFGTYVEKVYRHRDTLKDKSASIEQCFLVAYLLIHGKWDWAEKIFYKLRETN